MKVREILVENKSPDGTYAGVRFSEETIKAVIEFCKEHKIPNSIVSEKVHTTLLYSKKYLPNYKPLGQYKEVMIGTPTRFDVWKSKPTDDNPDPSSCLVLEFNCPALVDRHKELMKEHEALYDFDEYKPHITFSYNIKDMDVESLPKFTHSLEIVEEYSQDLDLNWAKDNSKE